MTQNRRGKKGMKGNIGIEGSFANVYFLLLVLSKNCLASLDCFIPFSDCSCQNTGKDDSSKLKKEKKNKVKIIETMTESDTC